MKHPRTVEEHVTEDECQAFYIRWPHSTTRYGPEPARCYSGASSPIHRPVGECMRKPCPWPDEHHDFGVGTPGAFDAWTAA